MGEAQNAGLQMILKMRLLHAFPGKEQATRAFRMSLGLHPLSSSHGIWSVLRQALHRRWPLKKKRCS